MRWHVLIVLLAIGAQCIEAQVSPPPLKKKLEVTRADALTNLPQAAEEDTIREVVFRYLEKNNPYTQQTASIKDYCLAIGYNVNSTEPFDPSDLLRGTLTDPSDTFMERFAYQGTVVHKASTSLNHSRFAV